MESGETAQQLCFSLLLLRGHLHAEQHLIARWQLLLHVVLHASEEEWCERGVQRLDVLGGAGLGEVRILVDELIARRELMRVQQVQQREQLAEVVLNGSAGQKHLRHNKQEEQQQQMSAIPKPRAQPV